MKQSRGGSGVTVARNATLLVSSSFFARFLLLGFNILLARQLGVEQFGVYSFALSYTTLLSVIVEFSLQQLIVRDVARNPELAGSYFSNALALKCLAFLLALLVVPISSTLLGYSDETQTVLYIMSIGLLFDAVKNCCIAVFNAGQQMQYSGALSITEETCFTALGVASLGLGGGIITIVACRVIAQAVTQLVGVLILVRKMHVRPQAVNYKICTSLMRQASHFFGASVFTGVSRNLDMVLLLSMQGAAAVGFYAAAGKVVKLTTYFSKAFSDALYPVLSKQAALPERKLLVQTYREAMKWLMIAVVPFVALATVQSANIMGTLYGPGFVEASFVFQIFAWRAALGFFTQFCGNTLFALEQQTTVFKATGVGAAVSLLLYLILIPYYSYTGAAFAFFAGLLAEFILQFVPTHRRLKTAPFAGIVFKPIVAGIGLAVFCHIFGTIPIIALAGLGLVVYLACLLLLGAISREEVEAFWGFLMTSLQRRTVAKPL